MVGKGWELVGKGVIESNMVVDGGGEGRRGGGGSVTGARGG